jgi:predicted Zn-dependent protease
MRRIARYRSDRLPQYLLTHPNPEARLHYIESLIDSENMQANDNILESYDFDFMRFKYRVLSQVKYTSLFKASMASIIAAGNSSEMSRIMAYYGLSQISKSESDYKQGLKYLQKVIDYFPYKNILMVDKGVMQFEGRQYREAKKTLKEALQRDSSDMYATFTLAKLMYRIGNLTESESYLRTVSYHMPEYSADFHQILCAQLCHLLTGCVALPAYHLIPHEYPQIVLVLCPDSYRISKILQFL